MRDAGIIGFVPKGEYSDTETYDFLQFVYYGDSTYVAKKETTGNPPAEDNEFWQLLAKGRVLGVSGVKGDKETDYRTGDVNITAEDVGAIPAQNGQAGGDLTVKSGWFPLLNLVRNEYGQNAAIQMTCGSKTQNGILLEAWVPNAESTSPGFQIRDRINNFVFFSCRAIGNVIRSKGFHPLALKNDDASGKNSGCGIQLQNLNKNLMSIQAVQISDDKDAELRVFDQTVSPALALLQISNRQRQIHDYKTGTKKEILVEGDAASLLKILRTASNANYKPGINVFDAKEFSGNSENIPSSDFYHIITMQGQDIREEYVTQLAVGMTKDSLYYRRMDHDVWGEWKRVIFDGDASCFQPGETFSIPTNTPLAGILTTSAKEIYFTIPLPKSATGRSVSISCTGLRVRGNSGYIIENKDISEYKVTITVIENLLKVLIVNPSGETFYDTNNIVLAVCGVFTITFL